MKSNDFRQVLTVIDHLRIDTFMTLTGFSNTHGYAQEKFDQLKKGKFYNIDDNKLQAIIDFALSEV